MKITLAQKLLNIAAQKFWTSPRLPEFFPQYMLELHSMMRCAVPLLRAGYERAVELAPSDSLAASTAVYLREHIDEEMHHDEWLLDDMVVAGMDRDAILRRPPGALVAQLAGEQYCWIHHAHPAALFGYLGILEDPPDPRHLDEIQGITGLPELAFRCLRLHGEHDLEHRYELQAAVESLPLTEATAGLISTSAFATMQLLVALMDQISQGE
jgi:hypothetical protein